MPALPIRARAPKGDKGQRSPERIEPPCRHVAHRGVGASIVGYPVVAVCPPLAAAPIPSYQAQVPASLVVVAWLTACSTPPSARGLGVDLDRGPDSLEPEFVESLWVLFFYVDYVVWALTVLVAGCNTRLKSPEPLQSGYRRGVLRSVNA